MHLSQYSSAVRFSVSILERRPFHELALCGGTVVALVLAPLRKLSRRLRVPIDIELAFRGFVAGESKARHGKHRKMTEYSSSQAKADDCAQAGALANAQTTPPPRVTPMPTQVIEFWTPGLLFEAIMRRFRGTLPSIGSHGAAFSAADSNEPR
jgi:hypothetical protein